MISPESASVLYTTYSQFCAKTRSIALAAGIGETTKPAFDNHMFAGLIKAQRYIDCLRKIQVSFYDKSQMNENCGVATLAGPRGKVNLVYAFKPGTQCIKHFYSPVTPHAISCWIRENPCRYENIPPGVGTAIWQNAQDVCCAYLALYPGAEEDDRCWKCDNKFVAVGQNGEIYLAPRPPCGYLVAVHWEGIRRSWSSSDSIPDEADLIDWLAEYVQSEMALRVDNDLQLAAALKGNSATKFADMMYWCTEERMMQFRMDCSQGLDVGNLSQMFLPIYPYPYQSVSSCPTAEIVGGGGDGGDPGEPPPDGGLGGEPPPSSGHEFLVLEGSDFDDVAHLTAVETWSDKSGQANHVTQAVVGNQPWVDQFYKCNGHATVRFQFLTLIRFLNRAAWNEPYQSVFVFVSAEIIAIVQKDNDPPLGPTADVGAPFQVNNGSGSSSHIPLTDGNVYENFGNAARPNSGNPATSFAGAFTLYNVRATKVLTTQVARKIYVGSTLLEDTAGGGVWVAPKPGNGIRIGAGFAGSAAPAYSHYGNIAAIYLFDEVLNSSDRALWDTYIFGKWGLHIQ